MIIDKFSRVEKYIATLPHMEEALACLEQVKSAAPGRYEFSGGFILIQEGTTSPLDAGDFEAHRKYLDVQFLLEGAETIVWADIADLCVSVPYDAHIDRGNYCGDGCTFEMKPGMFYVCDPHDAHKACCHTDTPTRFRKAVIKLSLED